MRPAPACLSEFVSASWTRRNTVSCAPGGSSRASPSTATRHRQPGRAHLADELVDLAQPRLRQQLALRPIVSQHAQQAAHLAERLSPGDRHGLHGRRRALRRLLCGEDSAVGQRDHHAQVVGDDVVHLPRDAGALRGGRALLERGLVGVALAHARAQTGGSDRQAGKPDERLERVVGAPAGGGQHGAQAEHRRGEHGAAARLVGGDRVQPHQQRGVGEHLHVGDPLNAGDQGERREDPHRPAASPHERHCERRAEQHQRERMRLLGQGVRQREQQDAGREREIRCRLVSPRECDQALDCGCVHSSINLRAGARRTTVARRIFAAA